MLFGLSGTELIFILLLALLIFGPQKLPQIGRTLGRGMAQFRKASTELQRTLNAEGITDEIRQGAEEIRKSDPRRVLRDQLDPRKILDPEPAKKLDDEPSVPTAPKGIEEPPAPTAPTAPAGSVARSGRDAAAMDDDGSKNDPTSAGQPS